MYILTIDNTRTAGNFFDNIANFNYLATEYPYINIKDLNLYVKNEDHFVVSDEYKPFIEYNNGIMKYDYINNDNIEEYKKEFPYYLKLYNNLNNNMFILTKEQYQQYIDFLDEHKQCLLNNDDINNGIVLEYHINYSTEELLPFFNYVKCYICGTEYELKDNNKEVELSDKIFNSYEIFLKYKNKFDIVEFFRFMEIYNEYKEPLIIRFINTGIGNSITVQTKEFIFNISNVDNW